MSLNISSFHMLILILSDYSKLVGEKTRESCRENENIKKKKEEKREEMWKQEEEGAVRDAP